MSDEALRTVPRLATDAERRHIKTVTRHALDAVGGGEAFSPATRVEKAALSKYAGPAYPDHFIPADVLLELDRLAGAPLLVSTLARMLGYRLVPAEGDAPQAKLDLSDAQSVAKETGDVVNLLLTLLSSGRDLDAADRREILREVTEAKAALYHLVVKLAGGGH
jgi:hypothetical protein